MIQPQTENGDCSREATIVNELGLHARSAAKIVALAGKAVHGVWLLADAEEIDATSTLDILTLYRPKGSKLKIRIENPVDRPILNAIARLIKDGFGE